MSKRAIVTIALAGALTLAACSSGTTAPLAPTGSLATGSAAVLLSVAPASAATSVNPASPITVTFNHPMMNGMEMLVLLHEGSVTGATVAGAATWSADRSQLTFAPTQPLKAGTTYVVHLSPNLSDATGHHIDFAACAQQLGGHSVSSGMMTGGMMGGGSGQGSMMGPGWQSGTGTWGYGMTFSFTTA